MYPVKVKSRKHITFGVEEDSKNCKLKVVNHVIISKHKNIFQKVTL